MTRNLPYRILAVGKIRKPWIKNGIEIYLKRLNGLSILEIKDSNPQKEAELINKKLNENEKLIVVSEDGAHMSSIQFSKYLIKLGSQPVLFALGGPDGFDPKIKNKAYSTLSLSSMTFTHEIARLILLEQIYRAQTIIQGSPYHRT